MIPGGDVVHIFMEQEQKPLTRRTQCAGWVAPPLEAARTQQADRDDRVCAVEGGTGPVRPPAPSQGHGGEHAAQDGRYVAGRAGGHVARPTRSARALQNALKRRNQLLTVAPSPNTRRPWRARKSRVRRSPVNWAFSDAKSLGGYQSGRCSDGAARYSRSRVS